MECSDRLLEKESREEFDSWLDEAAGTVPDADGAGAVDEPKDAVPEPLVSGSAEELVLLEDCA